MWGELLAQRADPLLRSFEIADSGGRLLLTLPFREILERVRKPPGPMPAHVQAAHALLQKTRTLTTALRNEIETAQGMIKAARSSMEQTQRVLARFPPRMSGDKWASRQEDGTRN